MNTAIGVSIGLAVGIAVFVGVYITVLDSSADDWGNCPSNTWEVAEATGTDAAHWEIKKSGPTIEYIYYKQGDAPKQLRFPAHNRYVGVLMGHGYTSAFTQFTNSGRSRQETMPEVTGPFTWICISR